MLYNIQCGEDEPEFSTNIARVYEIDVRLQNLAYKIAAMNNTFKEQLPWDRT